MISFEDRRRVVNTLVVVGYPEQSPEPESKPEFVSTRQGIAMTKPDYYGIDVSKQRLDVGSTGHLECSVDNTASGHRQLVSFFRKREPARIAIEATGHYSHAVACALTVAGFAVFIVQPGRVRYFAHSQGLLAKTDAIDAQLIARYAAKSEHLRQFVVPDESLVHLKALVNRRDQLVGMRTQEKCHKEACVDKEMLKIIQQNMNRLTKFIVQLDRAIAQAILESEELTQKAQCLQKTKGIGPQTAACLLVHCPELGTLNRQEIAALTGTAPYAQDSGAKHGARCICGGRARVRCALYMAAVTASRCNGPMKTFYGHLIKCGKKAKVALVAVMRKMAIYLNSQMKEFSDSAALQST